MRKGSKQRVVKFQYDPLGYALNFDDGCADLKVANVVLSKIQTQEHGSHRYAEYDYVPRKN